MNAEVRRAVRGAHAHLRRAARSLRALGTLAWLAERRESRATGCSRSYAALVLAAAAAAAALRFGNAL